MLFFWIKQRRIQRAGEEGFGLGLGVLELGYGLVDAAEQRIQFRDDPFLLR